MFNIGNPVACAHAAISAELPTHTAVAGSPNCLSSSTDTSESLPPPIGTRLRLGKLQETAAVVFSASTGK